MPEERYGERTEPATPRRRQEARERGHVARSQDLSSAGVLLAAILAMKWFGADMMAALSDLSRNILAEAGRFEVSALNIRGYGIIGGLAAGRVLLPILLAVMAAGMGVNLLQVGFLFTAAPLEFRLDRMNPISGFARIFSYRGVVRLVSVVLKMAIIGTIVWMTLQDREEAFLSLMDMDVQEIMRYLLAVAWALSIRVGLALLAFALIDYGYQRFQYEIDLRMSRLEVQEELKRLEGDPEIKRRRRRIQRNLALQRMMAGVPKAAVVITNPTELAIALEYDPADHDAPRVIAKGAGYIAERIREIAGENGIPIVRKPDLAQVLFRTVEVGRTIPVELYKAVADILAYVYRITGRKVTA